MPVLFRFCSSLLRRTRFANVRLESAVVIHPHPSSLPFSLRANTTLFSRTSWRFGLDTLQRMGSVITLDYPWVNVVGLGQLGHFPIRK